MREPLDADLSTALYGVVFEDENGTVLHPEDMEIAPNPITGQPARYIHRPQSES